MTKRQDPPSSPPVYPVYPPAYVVYRDEDTIDLVAYWRVVIKRWKLVGAITVFATAVSVVTALLLPPVFRAEVLLAPVEQEKGEGLGGLANQLGELSALAGISFGASKDKTAEFIAALKSRALTASFVKEHNLMPVLFADRWDRKAKSWKVGSDAPTEWNAFEMWDNDIRRVSLDRRSGLVTLAIEWKDPSLAAKWANDLVRSINSRLRADAVEEATRNIAYLQKQLPQTSSVEVQQAIYRLIEAQTKKKMIASTRSEYAFTVIDPAVPPERKYKPNRSAIVYTGALLGLILGILAAAVMNRNREPDSEP